VRESEPEEEPLEFEDIDMSVALQNCGTMDVFKVAVKEYYDTIESRADDIERFAKEKDFKNYTILVHALKSSSRLIGATGLSELAAHLERCGDEQNAAEIEEKTPALLELYRSYLQKLSSVAPEKHEEDKPVIDAARYQEALVAIKECAASFDFNALDSIMEMLDAYAVPPEEVKKFSEIKRCVRAGDSSALLKLL
jgi:HPt (histidine-containing phosphotransfer) domain-containing protein